MRLSSTIEYKEETIAPKMQPLSAAKGKMPGPVYIIKSNITAFSATDGTNYQFFKPVASSDLEYFSHLYRDYLRHPDKPDLPVKHRFERPILREGRLREGQQDFHALFQAIWNKPVSERSIKEVRLWSMLREYVDIDAWLNEYPLPEPVEGQITEKNNSMLKVAWSGISTPETFRLRDIPDPLLQFNPGEWFEAIIFRYGDGKIEWKDIRSITPQELNDSEQAEFLALMRSKRRLKPGTWPRKKT